MCRAAGHVFQDPEAQAVLRDAWSATWRSAWRAPAWTRRIPARVDQALELAGAGHLRGRAIRTLSGGERQRVALAAVLGPGAGAAAARQPTSQLDEPGADALVAALRGLADAGAGVVLGEHRHERGRPAADRVVALRDGVSAAPADGVLPPPGAPPPAGPVRARLRASGRRTRPPGARRRLPGAARGRGDGAAARTAAARATLLRVLAGLHQRRTPAPWCSTEPR